LLPATTDMIGQVPAIHVHELPLRWADLDQLNHVNNVVMQEYAAEARAMLADDGVLDAGASVAATTVTFLRPLLLSRRPVEVTSSLDGEVLTQEIAVRDGDERTVHARVVTTYGPPLVGAPVGSDDAETFDVRVRRSDLGADGVVTPVKIAEFFQEGRILHVSTSLATWKPGAFVIGTTEVAYARPVRWRREPYGIRAWFDAIGSASVTMRAELVDGDALLATARTVLVGFDPVAQTSRRFDDVERAAVTALLRPER
jgi:acyl-CoA thioester hydrolase